MKKIFFTILLILSIFSVCNAGEYGKYDIHQFKVGSALSLEKALTRIGSVLSELEISDIVTISDPNVFIPSTMKLRITKAGRIDHGVGCDLWIRGDFKAGNYTCFGDPNNDWVHFERGATNAINPYWFGAKGDDSTVNTTYFARSIACITDTNGGTILVPSGIYRTAKIQINKSYIIFAGVDKNNCVIVQDPNRNDDLIQVYDPNGYHFITIRDLTLDGNETHQNGVGGWKGMWSDQGLACINIERGYGHSIHDCIIRNGKGFGICIAGGNETSWQEKNIISHNYIYDIGQTNTEDQGHGIDVSAKNTIVTDNIIINCFLGGIVQEETGQGIIINNNTIHVCKYGISVFNSEKRVIVSNNNIADCIVSGIQVERNNWNSQVEKFIISNNIINNVGNGSTGHGIYLNTAGNGVVSSNILQDCDQYSIHAYKTWNVEFISNIGTGTTSGSGLVIENSSDVIVNGNDFYNNSRGITTVGTCNRVRIINNILNSNTSYGILFNTGIIDLSLIGNIGYGNTLYDIDSGDSENEMQLIVAENNFGSYHSSYLHYGSSIKPYEISPISINGLTIAVNNNIPTSGNWPFRSLVINTDPDSTSAFLICTTKGTSGILNAGITTATTVNGSTTFRPSSMAGLVKGAYVTIAGVSGIKRVDYTVATLASTTVYADSDSGQKVLKVTIADNFTPGEWITINRGGVREEHKEIRLVDMINDQLTLTDNLTYTHTATEVDVVENVCRFDSAANATVINAAVAYSVPVFGKTGDIVPQ